MSDQVTIVNNVLHELREDPITSVGDTDYSGLIARFVNRAIHTLEDINHHWAVYITEIDLTVLADDATISYDLTTTTDRSVLLRDTNNDMLPAAYDITSNEVGQLYDCPYSELLKQRALTNDTSKTVTNPKNFAVIADSDGRGWTIKVIWPVTSIESARTWRTYWYVPQGKLTVDGTDDNTEVKLPASPIELYTIYLALNERGEEMGQPGGLAFQAYIDSIGSALDRDRQTQRRGSWGDATDWNNNECL